jgi:hypothetical protein
MSARSHVTADPRSRTPVQNCRGPSSSGAPHGSAGGPSARPPLPSVRGCERIRFASGAAGRARLGSRSILPTLRLVGRAAAITRTASSAVCVGPSTGAAATASLTRGVYFVRNGAEGPIKIGFTRGSAQRRVRELQSGNPVRLQLLATISGGVAEERQLHRTMAAYRLRPGSEWFERDAIEALLAASDLTPRRGARPDLQLVSAEAA